MEQPTPRGPTISATVSERFTRAVVAPLAALKSAYVPLLMIYFAYGALGLVAVADSFWVKKALDLSAADLARLGVWLTLPWTIKMVFGELVDTVPILGSQRRVYVFIGAGLIALAMVMLAGAASGWLTFASPDRIYVIASLISVTGVVLQDVVADAMSTEVVPLKNADGTPRDKAEIDHDLGMVQVLGRLALSIGIFATAGLAGLLAQVFSYATVFLIGLVIPLISMSGALLVRLETSETRPTDWRLLGGGLAFGAVVTALLTAGVPFSEEIVLALSLAVIGTMLVRVTAEMPEETRLRILFAATIIFAFRAVPGPGEGYRWYAIDRLGFDEAFFGVLGQIGAALALASLWLLSDTITRQPVARVLLALTLAGAALSLPDLSLVFGLHEWTERTFGFGARTIALVDTAAQSPLDQLSMIPLLTLIAVYAPPAKRAIWFALMASFMNLALVTGGLMTRWLNEIYVVGRGSYDNLPALYLTMLAMKVAIPLAAILAVGRRVR